MASLISPGIVIKERDLTTAVVTNSQSITGAFASTFAKGPVGEITTISSQSELLEAFGKPGAANAEDWFVASEFLNYGGRLAVVRTETGTNSANTGSNAALNVRNSSDWEGGLGSGETFVAKTPGTWGNALRVIVADRGADQLITITGGWDNSPVVGSPLTFNLNGGGTATAEVFSWDAATGTVGVILDDPTRLITTNDEIEDGNEVGTFTHDGVTETARVPGTYTPAAHTNGASFQVVVANDSGNGGAVTVTLLTAGDGYSVGDTITLAAADLGGAGSDIVVTVATLDPDASIGSVADWWSNTSVGGVALSAIGPRPGTSQYASDRSIKYDEVHVAVVDSTGAISGTAGTVIERLTYLSKLSDGRGTENQATYYKTAINEGSEYIYTGTTIVGAVAPSSSNAGDAWGQASTDTGVDMFTLAGATSTDLDNGADDYAYTAGEIDAAYEVFSETEQTEVDFVLMGGSMTTETDTKMKAGSVMAVAQNRKDCIAFLSPHKGNQVGTSGALTRSLQKTNTINFFNSLASTSYAVFDSGYKYMYDRFNDLYRWVPCNGDVAGLCVSTSATLEDWFSPAGTNRGGLRNAVKLAYNPTQSDRDELYQSRINPIVSMPGAGTVLFGDKTALASPSAFDRINVRRLFLAVQKRAETLAKGVLFEQNDATTRVGFASALNSFMAEIQARRGVTDFLVVCDESNNTASVIDRNEFVAEIYIKPTRSINYITVTLTATKSGVSFSEVIGG
jgi:hypothetical protein